MLIRGLGGMMIKLTDVTFTIPVKFDSNERKRNLEAIVSYLTTHFLTNIMIIEDGPHQALQDVLSSHQKKFTHIFVKKEPTDLMHRTKYLNFMCREAKTPYVVNYDTDVLLPINQYILAVDMLRNNVADIVYPYDGRFVDLSGSVLDTVIRNKSLVGIDDSHGRILTKDSVGGCVFVNKAKYMDGGMENENFISWGPEDLERKERFEKLGYTVRRLQGPLFHLNHPKSLNSANETHSAFIKNGEEYKKVKNMSAEELRAYVNTWSWK
jgi:predicted glycosyltransferase involved in capsule biosynthesis